MAYSRTEVARALFDLLCGVSWGDVPRSWAYTSQRVQIWDDCPEQPAMYLQEGDERWAQATRVPPVRIWEYKVVVYQNTGKDEANSRPADENDRIMEAIESALGVSRAGQAETLGGMVHSVKIVGTVLKESGDLDGQGIICIPIEVTVP